MEMTPPELGLTSSVSFMIDRLIANKRYPKYQFERASEIFLAPFIEEWLGTKLEKDLELVAMEFPLKKPLGNQSTNADYLLYSPRPHWWLVEMKTEVGLLPLKQLMAYQTALSRGKTMSSYVGDIDKIRGKSRKGPKYEALKLAIDNKSGRRTLAAPLGVVFITPHAEKPAELKDFDFRWCSLLEMLETFVPTKHQELWDHVKRLKEAF
jgi:hypothetical protein